MALCLGDYAEGDWYFIAVCKNCGRETALEPAEILARPGTEKVHRGMRVGRPGALSALPGMPP